MPPRILWVDNIRAIACAMVILIHICSSYIYKFGKIDMATWQVANIVDSFTRLCVPLFFMISGFIFMQNKNVKIKNIFKLIANIILYSAISIIAAYVTSGYKYPAMSAVLNIFHKPAGYHLWFLYVLLLCYVFFSILSIKSIPPLKAFILCTIIFVVFNSQTNSITSFYLGFNYNGPFALQDNLFFYITYGALGAYLGNADISSRFRWWYLSGFLVTGSIIAILTYDLSLKAGKLNSSFYSYVSIGVMLTAVCMFLFIKSLDHKTLIFGRLTPIISAVSLPIYGIHAIILGLFTYMRPSNILIDIPVTFTFVLATSTFFGICVNKIDRFRIFS